MTRSIRYPYRFWTRGIRRESATNFLEPSGLRHVQPPEFRGSARHPSGPERGKVRLEGSRQPCVKPILAGQARLPPCWPCGSDRVFVDTEEHTVVTKPSATQPLSQTTSLTPP